MSVRRRDEQLRAAAAGSGDAVSGVEIGLAGADDTILNVLCERLQPTLVHRPNNDRS